MGSLRPRQRLGRFGDHHGRHFFGEGRRVRLISRRGIDHTARFADIAAAVADLPAREIALDGELCVFDGQLVSQFHLLGDSTTGELATPPVFIAFDVLSAGARDLRDRPLSYRRPTLEDAIVGSRYVLPALRLGSDGLAAWDEVKRGGWEGLVAKRDASLYRGGPTREWLKVKQRYERRFVVVGLDVPLSGACSLLLAARGVFRLPARRGSVMGEIAAVYNQTPVQRSPHARRARAMTGSATARARRPPSRKTA